MKEFSERDLKNLAIAIYELDEEVYEILDLPLEGFLIREETVRLSTWCRSCEAEKVMSSEMNGPDQ